MAPPPRSTEASFSTWPGTSTRRRPPASANNGRTSLEPTLYLLSWAPVISVRSWAACAFRSGVNPAVARMCSRSLGRPGS